MLKKHFQILKWYKDLKEFLLRLRKVVGTFVSNVSWKDKRIWLPDIYNLKKMGKSISFNLLRWEVAEKKFKDMFSPELMSLPKNPYSIPTLFFKDFFFWCGAFLKSLSNLLQHCFCFMLWIFELQVMWDLSSPTRDRTCTHCIGKRSLSTWTNLTLHTINHPNL